MTAILSQLVDAGVLTDATVRLARHLGWMYAEADDLVIAAAACTIAAGSSGSICFDPAHPSLLLATDDATASIPWPAPQPWLEALCASPMVAVDVDDHTRPMMVVNDVVYLTRHWNEQEKIARWLIDRVSLRRPDQVGSAPSSAARVVDEVDDDHTRALRCATTMLVCVIAGGPGTGKTTIVSEILDALSANRTEPLRVILSSPTGRAASHLDQAVSHRLTTQPHGVDPPPIRVTTGTLHRILGLKPRGGAQYDRRRPLPADIVVVDEASMLSLHLMAALLDAIGPHTRLILVGDPDQLASVDAGAVLADVVAAQPVVPVIRLTKTYRFFGAIADLADAIRRGDPDTAIAVLDNADDSVEWIRADIGAPDFLPTDLPRLRHDLVHQGLGLIRAGESSAVGEALDHLDAHRLLVAHRHGPSGVSQWNRVVHHWLAQAAPETVTARGWYPGLPIMVTRNDDALSVFNGDCGVIVDAGGLRLALPNPSGPRLISPDLIESWEPLYVSTIHKAQGSQFDSVSLLLPAEGTTLLTRELLYTGVTRAKTFLRLMGTETALRHAIDSPAVRASGLTNRLTTLRTGCQSNPKDSPASDPDPPTDES